MAQRLRLYDCRASRLPALVGLCQSDIQGVAGYVNAAQRRLLYAREAGDEGWWGTWAEILFQVSRSQPYITLPREIARLQSVNVCNQPVEVNNQFFEYLRFGNGRMPQCATNGCNGVATYTRNNAVTFIDLSNAPQFITVFLTDPGDVGKTVLIQGLDSNGVPVQSQLVLNQVQGQLVTLESPFVTTPQTFNWLTGIQKDQTRGQVKFFQTDPTTGDQVLLLTMEPSELTASYRRYFLDSLPLSCCPATNQTEQNLSITALAKLDLIPVQVDTDYCLLQNLEAITEECQSIRLSECDNPASKQMASERHRQAIGLLNGELAHYLGTNQPSVNIAPFGTARLEYASVGRLI